jgi:hypothetical protein
VRGTLTIDLDKLCHMLGLDLADAVETGLRTGDWDKAHAVILVATDFLPACRAGDEG